MNVPVADWKVTKYQKKLVNEVLDSGRLTYGPKTELLEKEFAKIHGRKYALFTNSGTSALQVALHAMKRKYGWKDGSEVIIPALTFMATMNVVLQNNLKPVLCDIDPDTLNIDVENAPISDKTVAIIPVHLLGRVADMDKINNLGLHVIEDSCETMFVKYKGKPVGSHSRVSCFSTYLAHLMNTGVGGFITTDDDELAGTMRSMMFHGRNEKYLSIDDKSSWKNRFQFDKPGYSYRATEMESALGLDDLKNYKKILKARQYNAGYLIENLKNIPHLKFPVGDLENHAFMLFPIIVDKDRDSLIDFLEKNDIQTRTIMPLTNQAWTMYALGPIEDNYPKTKYVNDHGFLIGCHQYLTKEQLDYVISKIKEFYG